MDSTLRFIDLTDGKEISMYSGPHLQTEYSGTVRFSRDNKLIFTSSEDGNIIAYDVATRESVGCFTSHNKPVIGIDIHPKITQKQIVSGSADGLCKIWSY